MILGYLTSQKKQEKPLDKWRRASVVFHEASSPTKVGDQASILRRHGSINPFIVVRMLCVVS